MASARKLRSGGGRHASSSSSTTTTPDLEEETCPICLEILAKKAKGGRAVRSSYAPSKSLGGIVILDCGHGFCKGYLTQYVRLAIREGRTRVGTLPCAEDKCKVAMQEGVLKSMATAADWKKHVAFNLDRKITEKPPTRFCPQPNCDGIAYLSTYPQASDIKRYLAVQCKECRHEFCANCSSGPHRFKSCDEVGDKDYFKWKKGKNVPPCPGCGHHVQKTSGCAYMNCPRCRTQWCWQRGMVRDRRLPYYGCKCYSGVTGAYRRPQDEWDVCDVILSIHGVISLLFFLIHWLA